MEHEILTGKYTIFLLVMEIIHVFCKYIDKSLDINIVNKCNYLGAYIHKIM